MITKTLLMALLVVFSRVSSASSEGIYAYLNLNSGDALVVDSKERIARFGPYGDMFAVCQNGIMCFETNYFSFAVPSKGPLEQDSEWETRFYKHTVIHHEEKFKILGREYNMYIIRAKSKEADTNIAWINFYSMEYGLVAMQRIVDDMAVAFFISKNELGFGARSHEEWMKH